MLEREIVLAMAVAAVAEECSVKPKKVIVHSFEEIQKSSLEQFIENNHIIYRKYQLEDAKI